MRVLMISHSDSPWAPHYSRFLMGRGDTVLLVSFSPVRIPGVDMEFVGAEPFDSTRNKHLFLTRVPRIRKIIRRFDPDVVFGPYLISDGLTAVLSSNRPTVVSARGGDVLPNPGSSRWGQRMRERVVRFVGGRADFVHAVSVNLERALLRLGVPESKIARFPVGINVDRFHPEADMPRSTATRLICVRKHELVYDIPAIIEALALLKRSGRQFHCTFLGGGSLLEANQRHAADAGLDGFATFIGHRPHEELAPALRQADIYISSSLSDGTSSSLLEGMASGLFPVVTRIEANEPWIADGRTGLMFEPGRADQLAACLKRAMDDAALRAAAVLENRRLVEQEGNMIRNMERLAELFERVIAQRRSS